MQLLLQSLYQTAEHISSNEITHREILFLLRHSEVKLHRLLRFLDEKDLRDSISKSISQDESLILQEQKSSLNTEEVDSNNESDEEIDKTEKDFYKIMGPRRKICYEYLSELIPEWFPTWYSREPPLDAIKQRRMIRLDMMSQRLDRTRYITFTECRRSSFRELGKEAFLLWLGNFQYPLTNNLAIEMLFYFANETVCEIVDLTLLHSSNLAEARGPSLSSGILSPGLPHEPPTVLTGTLINSAFEWFFLSRRSNNRILVL